jgi:hypothetical protein
MRIDSISLFRGDFEGPCPVYLVEFRADGGAIWNGYAFVERQGLHEAVVRAAGLRDRCRRVVEILGLAAVVEIWASPL